MLVLNITRGLLYFFSFFSLMGYATTSLGQISSNTEINKQEFSNLATKYLNNPKHKQAVILEITKCSNKGNPYCSDYLCLYFFSTKKYSDTYKFCSSYKSKRIRSKQNFILGFLFQTGHGVLQNEALAMKYYLKAAAQGEPYSAYNIAVIHLQKMELLIKTKQFSRELEKEAIMAYSWAKIAKALGYKSENKNSVSVDTVIRTLKPILTSRNLINEANSLSEKICSNIRKCHH